VDVALTTEHCIKALPKNDKGEVNQLKGEILKEWGCYVARVMSENLSQQISFIFHQKEKQFERKCFFN